MKQKAKNYHSGFVTIIGRPNVGKSSLMNRMIGEKIAIVSSKPQTTRSRIMGVLSRTEHQIVFLDTPGIHDPRTKLGEYMMHSVRDAMDGMDAVLVLFDVTHITENDLRVAEGMKEKKVPVILALNKIDLATPEQILAATAKAAEIGFEEIIPVSARTGDGVEELIKSLENHLPEGPQYFPEDMITDQPERILCAEIIREKALRHLRDEVPHGIGVEIMKIEALSDKLTEINATVYCERAAHKGIIIGKNGTMLQTIGTEARLDIEKLMDTHINLKLWVKIRPDWRNNASDLKNLGYDS
ncbi:GTPase Era [Clostridiales bacterium FE2011]|nr:GTPase Era [Clostridiales bacterium FE2011]QTE75215.1 GTPase Era [Clostridiales bacterium FE2010]